MKFSECFIPEQKVRSEEVPCTRDVYMLRKLLGGLVIGPIDKNNGESSLCCPVLYHEALTAMYNPDAGYTEIHPRKATAYKKGSMERNYINTS